jgi:hypothetical protein
MRYELVVFEDCEGRQSTPHRMPVSPVLYLPGTPSLRSMLRNILEETAEGFIGCHTLRTVKFCRTRECVFLGDHVATLYREESR